MALSRYCNLATSSEGPAPDTTVRAADGELIAPISSPVARATLAVAAPLVLGACATPGPVPAYVSALSVDVAVTCVTAVELVVTRARYA